MTAVRDHPERPPVLQRYVLWSLALRMDWQTGCGAASMAQLADDASCRERTVRNATSWARGAELLERTRRGHRLGDGRTVASEWRLTVPESQPAPGDRLTISTGTQTDLNRHANGSQPARRDAPSRTRSSRPSSSARGAANAAAPPLTQTPAPRRVPPCSECGKPFSEKLLADPDLHAMAMAGEIVHDECMEADNLRYLRACTIKRLIEDGAVDEAIQLGIRQPDEFPAWALNGSQP